MAASQAIEYKQYLYGVCVKKHYMERTTQQTVFEFVYKYQRPSVMNSLLHTALDITSCSLAYSLSVDLVNLFLCYLLALFSYMQQVILHHFCRVSTWKSCVQAPLKWCGEKK